MDKLEAIKDFLSNCSGKTLVELNKSYCDAKEDYDNDMVFTNDNDFWELVVCYGDYDEVARKIHYGDYRYTDEYIRLDGAGNAETISEYRVSDWINKSEIAEYIVENDNDLENEDIREILNENEE